MKKKSGWLVTYIIFVGVFITVYQNYLWHVDRVDTAKTESTKADLAALHAAVNMFKMDTGRYPTAEEGLRALVSEPSDVNDWTPGGYLEQVALPKDSWKNDFVYILNPDSNSPFDIISYGADGKPGGEGFDADLHSTDLRSSQ